VADRPLADTAVLVTRPSHQAGPLCALIGRAGGTALRLPAFEIGPPKDDRAAHAVTAKLDRYDLAVFVSPNAVRGLFQSLIGTIPATLKLAAVGPATAQALADAGHERVIVPASGFNSEALLELPEFVDVADKRVVIFRGDGGRDLLRQVLQTRGAAVEYAEVYRRLRPGRPSAEVRAALCRHEVDAVVVGSAQALESLVSLCDDELRDGLLAAQLVVASGRMIQMAESLGFRDPLVASEPVDRALVDALIAWRTGTALQETD
jgi:uroporphyrinogen-III synthase